MTNEEIKDGAIKFARDNGKDIAKRFADLSLYAPDDYPVSVFMAGSPGAGKTEFSKYLINILEGGRESRVVRIDADEVRAYMPGYTGANSALFNGAVSLVVEKVHDLVLKQRQSFIFDGTLSNYNKAIENIKRSISHNRQVFIFYIYQNPKTAWEFTQAREASEGRNIPKDAFIDKHLNARETIYKIISELDDQQISLFLVKKELDGKVVESIIKLNSVSDIDANIPKSYTKEELYKIL